MSSHPLDPSIKRSQYSIDGGTPFDIDTNLETVAESFLQLYPCLKTETATLVSNYLKILDGFDFEVLGIDPESKGKVSSPLVVTANQRDAAGKLIVVCISTDKNSAPPRELPLLPRSVLDSYNIRTLAIDRKEQAAKKALEPPPPPNARRVDKKKTQQLDPNVLGDHEKRDRDRNYQANNNKK